MNESFDIFNLIFLAIAVIIFLRLRSVLGRRTGNERPPYDPYSPHEGKNTKDNQDGQNDTASRPSSTDNVVPLPNVHQGEREPVEQAAPGFDIIEQIRKFTDDDTPLSRGLLAIANRDTKFDPEHFMTGAEAAYEIIITAFSGGDKKQLKKLLSAEVYEGFAGAIDQRKKVGQTMQTAFVGSEQPKMLDAVLDRNFAEITVKYKSSLIRSIYDSEKNLIEGDERDIEKVTDIWTFGRDISKRDPNWKLISTETES